LKRRTNEERPQRLRPADARKWKLWHTYKREKKQNRKKRVRKPNCEGESAKEEQSASSKKKAWYGGGTTTSIIRTYRRAPLKLYQGGGSSIEETSIKYSGGIQKKTR